MSCNREYDDIGRCDWCDRRSLTSPCKKCQSEDERWPSADWCSRCSLVLTCEHTEWKASNKGCSDWTERKEDVGALLDQYRATIAQLESSRDKESARLNLLLHLLTEVDGDKLGGSLYQIWFDVPPGEPITRAVIDAAIDKWEDR